MSFLNLNKLLPARKAWRVFANKVQTKLHKLHPSKTTIKKPKNRLKNTSKKSSCWPTFFSIQPRVQRKRFRSQTYRHNYHHSQKRPSAVYIDQLHSYHHSYHFQKRPSAVYIDQLFIEPAVSIKSGTENNGNRKEKKICSSTSVVKKPEQLADGLQNMAGMSKGKGKLNQETHSADDMWESLVLASPQMNGINERAEEFIARFRADMLLQEQLARHL